MESLRDHTDFLDKCLAYNITVMAGSPLHAPDDRAMTDRDWLLIKNQLISDVSNLRHPAITMWNVGNELNLPTEGFICDEDPATNATCVYSGKQGVLDLLDRINELCGVVKEAGMLCSTPLAEYYELRSNHGHFTLPHPLTLAHPPSQVQAAHELLPPWRRLNGGLERVVGRIRPARAQHGAQHGQPLRHRRQLLHG